MRQTPNYNLPQFDNEDFFSKEIINDAFKKIDTGISDIQEIINSSSVGDIATIQEIIEAREGAVDLLDNIRNIRNSIALKEDKTNDLLATTNKTLVGAINEIKSSVDLVATNLEGKQNSTDETLSTVNKTIVGAINEVKDSTLSIADKQNSTDAGLSTVDKTIVGSINELVIKSNDLESKVSGFTTYVPSLGSGLSDFEPGTVTNEMVVDKNGIVTYSFCVTGGKTANNIANGATLCYIPSGINVNKIAYGVINTETTGGARGFGMAIIHPPSKSILVYFPGEVPAVSSVKGTVTFQAKFP